MPNILEEFDGTVNNRINNKTADYSIAKQDVGNTIKEGISLASLIPVANVDLSYPKDWITRDASYNLFISLQNNVSGDTTISQNWQPITGAGGTSVYSLEANGFANAYTSTNGSISAYSDNVIYIIAPDETNSGSSTYEINNLGDLPIKKLVSGTLVNLSSGDLSVNGYYALVWRTSYFYVIAGIPAESAITGLIQAGSNITLSGSGTTADPYIISASGGGAIPHATASGTDTYTVTIAGVASYSDGDSYLIRFTNGNTTGSTLNINSLGAKTLYKNNDGVLIGGDIISGGEMICVYNSTLDAFQVIGTSPNSLIAYVTNADSVTLTKGMAVYAFGGQGDRMTVKRAQNTGDATSAQTVGLVLSSSIGAGQTGFIMMQGLLDSLSILPTSTFADGDPIYLGATPGSITKVKPYAPNHLVYLGVVTTASNGSAGRMYVKVQNGYELDELHNVQAQSPTLKDTLWYDNTVSPPQWKTASISTILGYTPLEGNAAITGATKTKITYDSKGLVISGADIGASDLPSGIDAAKIADGSVSNTEFQYLNGVTSAIQTQINNINSGISTKKFINNTPTAAHTGTTTNTIVQSVLIPANTYTVGDIVRISPRAFKTGNGGVATLRFYANTSVSLSGAVTIAQLRQSSAVTGMIAGIRNLSITSATTIDVGDPSSTNMPSDETSLGNLGFVTNMNINWTVDQYIIYAIQLGSVTDSATFNHYIIEKR